MRDVKVFWLEATHKLAIRMRNCAFVEPLLLMNGLRYVSNGIPMPPIRYMYFAAMDRNGGYDLWVTDGTKTEPVSGLDNNAGVGGCYSGGLVGASFFREA